MKINHLFCLFYGVLLSKLLFQISILAIIICCLFMKLYVDELPGKKLVDELVDQNQENHRESH